MKQKATTRRDSERCRLARRRRPKKSLLETAAEAHAAIVSVCRALHEEFTKKTEEDSGIAAAARRGRIGPAAWDR